LLKNTLIYKFVKYLRYHLDHDRELIFFDGNFFETDHSIHSTRTIAGELKKIGEYWLASKVFLDIYDEIDDSIDYEKAIYV